MTRNHTHTCRTCPNTFTCNGDPVNNHDGFPEVVCSIYHVSGLDQCETCWCDEQRELSDDEATEALSQAAQKAGQR